MRIDIEDQYKNLCYIQEIKPGKLKHCKILLCVLLTIITVGIPLILYWKWQKFRNVFHHFVFQQVENDSQEINHYLIIDSKKLQGKQNFTQRRSRKIIYRNFIISPYLTQKQSALNPYTGLMQTEQQKQLCKYIEHKNLKYVIKDNTLRSLSFKTQKPFDQLFSNGLTSEQVNQSLKIFGKSGTFLLSFHHIFRKILHMKKLRIVFVIFAIKKIVFGFLEARQQQNSALVSGIILSQIIFAFFMMLIMSIFGSVQHNKIHEKLQHNTFYEVLRQGQIIEVKLNDLYVGDVVIPKKGQIIYFKGLFAASINSNQSIPYLIVNEKLYNRIDKPIQKTPLLSHLNQISQQNILNVGNIILNMDIKIENQVQQSNKTNKYQSKTDTNVKFFIIVTDNNFLQKFYKSYQEPCYFDNFQSLRHTFDTHQVIFESLFFVLAIIGIIMAEMMQKSQQNWIQILLSLIVICFPYNLVLFTTFTEIISMIRLNKKQISVINPSIEQIGISDHIFLQLSAFQTVQFPGYIKKQRCARMALPQNYEDSTKWFETFRKAKEESVFTFLGWAGIMNLPYFDSEPILKQIFQKVDFFLQKKEQYDEEQSTSLRVRNKDQSAIKIYWKEHQRFSISQKFIQCVVIQDLYTNRFQTKYFAIIEGEYASDDCDEYFDQIVDEVGRQQYKQIMKRLFLQGKKVKYISLKRLNLNDKNYDIRNLKREILQRKLLFGGFLVFDNWPTESSMKVLIEIDHIIVTNCQEGQGIKVSIFSVREQNALIGYDHILRNSKLFYEQQAKERVTQIQEQKSDCEGLFYVGNGILDRGCLLSADVSVNKVSQSFMQADFQIKTSQHVRQLFFEGIWAMQTTILTIVCLSLFNFCKIVGQLVLFHNDHEQDVEAQPLSTNIDRLFLIDVGALILPLLLLNIYQPTQKLAKKEHRVFFRIGLMFNVFITLVGLLTLFIIEFLDHSFQGMCISQQTNQKHETFSRHYQSHQFFNPKNSHSCQGLIDFVNISFALIVICVIDRQSESRKAKNFFIGIINKFYMIALWILSIFYFHIPMKSALRSFIVILAIVILVYFATIFNTKINSEKENDSQIQQYENVLKNNEGE